MEEQFPPQFKVDDKAWLESTASEPNMLVTIVERRQDPQTGKWSYKLKDVDGVPAASDDYVDEERLSAAS
jgi:hypothetical protein